MLLFLYQDRNTPIHQLSVGTKLLLLLLSSVLLLVIPTSNSMLLTGLLLFMSIGVVLVYRLAQMRLWATLYAVRWMLLILFGFYGVLPSILAQWPAGLSLVEELARLALFVLPVWRIVLLLLLALLFSYTSKTNALIDCLERFLAPLNRVGVRVDKLSLVMALSLRLIPLTFKVVGEVRLAQQARGVHSGFWAMRYLLPAVLVKLLAISEQLADAIDARGFIAERYVFKERE